MLDPEMYLKLAAMFIGGQVLALMFITVPDLRQKARLANKRFSLKDWWTSDWNLIIGTQVIGFLLFMGLDQFILWKPWILPQLKWIVAGIGAFGTPIIQSKFSQFGKSLSNLLDIKSNASDMLLGSSSSVSQVKEKYEEMTGKPATDISSPPATVTPAGPTPTP